MKFGRRRRRASAATIDRGMSAPSDAAEECDVVVLRARVVGDPTHRGELGAAADRRHSAWAWEYVDEHDATDIDAVIVVGGDDIVVGRPDRHPTVVWHRATARSSEVAVAALDAGVDAVVSGYDPLITIAQLDAVARRLPSSSTPNFHPRAACFSRNSGTEVVHTSYNSRATRSAPTGADAGA